jgi:endonuclease/exonuclease/phosphatase family metal-dependent hydrolase
MSQRTLAPRLLAALLVLPACDGDKPLGGGADDDEQWDGVGGKADSIFGVEEGTPEARAILRLVNEADFATLDDDVRLDKRAAQGIVERRQEADDGLAGFQTLAELDAVPFVGRTAFEHLRDYVIDEDRLGSQLRIATFNIRWFGLDGSLFGSFGSESRIETVRAFIEQHMADRDVLVFQEIVDLELFTEQVVPELDCVTYEGHAGKHQHVMVCTSADYQLVQAVDDDDFELEALDTGRLRPGVHGRVFTRTGTPVADLVAVHLKANEMSTERRLEQAEILAEYAAQRRQISTLPFIAIGDFNTHLAEHTGLPEHDEDLLAEILEPLQRVELPVEFTYQEKDGTQFRLDQSWLSDDIEVDHVVSPGACDLDLATDAAAIETHYDTLSDHCPLIVDLTLP